jgi:hypothetical protein
MRCRRGPNKTGSLPHDDHQATTVSAGKSYDAMNENVSTATMIPLDAPLMIQRISCCST